MLQKNKCGIFFPRYDFEDVTGCLKDVCHNDAHVCRDSNGKLIEWEDDYECKCGCWDDYEKSHGMEKPCIIYHEITDLEFKI